MNNKKQKKPDGKNPFKVIWGLARAFVGRGKSRLGKLCRVLLLIILFPPTLFLLVLSLGGVGKIIQELGVYGLIMVLGNLAQIIMLIIVLGRKGK